MMMLARYVIAACALLYVFPVFAEEKPLPIDDADALYAIFEKSESDEHARDDVRLQLGQDGYGGGNENYAKILSHIATGDEKWLMVAGALKCCLNEISSEALSGSMADAFLHSPESVLRRTPVGSLSEICASVPLNGDQMTREQFNDGVNAIKAAVARIQDPLLGDKKSSCLREVESLRWENGEYTTVE
jgi:hypothetical protein